jgi:hypothetical protein
VDGEYVLIIKQNKIRTRIGYGEVYGYYNVGVKYRAVTKAESQHHFGYAEVIDDSALILYSRKVKGYKSSHTDFFYSKTLTGEIKELTMDNLKYDFSSYPEFIRKATALYEAGKKAFRQKDAQGNYYINTIYKETVKN